MICSPVDLEAAEAAFFSAGAGDEGGGGGDVAGAAAVGARVGVGGGGVVVAGVGDVGSHAAAQRFQMTKNPPKTSSPDVISRIFTDRFQQICIIYISDDFMPCIFKTCQVVASISMTSQFDNFSYLIFGGILLYKTSVCHCRRRRDLCRRRRRRRLSNATTECQSPFTEQVASFFMHSLQIMYSGLLMYQDEFSSFFLTMNSTIF